MPVDKNHDISAGILNAANGVPYLSVAEVECLVGQRNLRGTKQ